MWGRLSRYDTFARAKAHVQTRSAAGGLLTVTALLLGAALLLSEVVAYARVRVEDHLAIDRQPGERAFEVTLELDLPALRCADADVRAEDTKGAPLEGLQLRLAKHALAADGRLALAAGMHPDSSPGCKLLGSAYACN